MWKENRWCLLVSFLSLREKSGNLSTPACPVAKQRQRRTISLLIAYFPNNHRRSVHYPLHYSTLSFSLSQQSWVRTLIQIRIVFGGGGGRYKDRTRNWRRCAVLLRNWRSRQRKALSCWAFIKIKYIKVSQPVQMCQVCDLLFSYIQHYCLAPVDYLWMCTAPPLFSCARETCKRTLL